MTQPFRIGVPSKGRLSELAAELLNQAGLRFRRQDRSLFARIKAFGKDDQPVEAAFLRTDDIPTLCAEGAIDLGITGSDLVAESGAEVTTRLALGVGHCRLAVCVPEESPVVQPKDLRGDRVATSFPTVTRNYLNAQGVTCHVVELTGSVEVMIALGVADAIVDLVETGSTLAANKLRILDEIGQYETVVIQNPRRQSELADRIVRRLEGVVIARAYSLLEYNVPEEHLAAAEKITPGFSSPTVNRLEKPGWYAVRAMVKRGDVIDIMERLDALGAEAILETAINNCRL